MHRGEKYIFFTIFIPERLQRLKIVKKKESTWYLVPGTLSLEIPCDIGTFFTVPSFGDDVFLSTVLLASK